MSRLCRVPGKTAGRRADTWQSCTAAWGASMRRGKRHGTHHQVADIDGSPRGGRRCVRARHRVPDRSDATLSPSSLGASSDLAQAGRWLQFLAGACALGAACAAVTLGALLLVIGLLVSAASGGSSPAAAVTGAVGIGIWALLVLSRAARASLAEQAPAGQAPAGQAPARDAAPAAVPGSRGGRGRQADLWLAAA